MKKIIILLILLCLSCSNVQAKNADTDEQIKTIVNMIESCPYQEPYKKLNGDNETKKPITIDFFDLSILSEKYKNFDALSWKRNKNLYIYINEKHKDAPIEALAALVAGRLFNDDTIDSLNEEQVCWLSEAYVWAYLTKGKEFTEGENGLIEREIVISKLLNADPYEGKYIIKLIDTNKGYESMPKTSPGYNDEETKEKIDHILRLYRSLKHN